MHGLRREWNFFFDSIIKAFNNKSSNFDSLPVMSQQFGYSLLFTIIIMICRVIMCFIRDRLRTDPNTVYYVRFYQLIFNHCCPNSDIIYNQIISVIKITKRKFYDLISKDKEKNSLHALKLLISTRNLQITRLHETYAQHNV